MAQTPIGYLVHCRGGAKYLQMQEPKLCDWVLRYEPVVLAAQSTSKELLRQAIQTGATLSDFLQIDSQENPPSEDDLSLIDAARDRYQRDGDLEFDDYPVVSGGDDPSGDYVLCWKWVERP